MTDPIDDYVRANRDQYPRDVLTEQLTAAGHRRAEIDAAWDRMGNPQPPTTAQPAAAETSWRQVAVPFAIVAVLVWFLFLRGGGGTATGPTTTGPRATPRPTVEHMLAAVHGDLSSEAEFKRIVDQIQAGGAICDPEPSRQRVGDLIVSSWQSSGKADSLLEWARALASVCRP